MKIETKFSVGERIWFMHDNKPISKKILAINIGVGVDYDKIDDIEEEDDLDENTPSTSGVKYYMYFWINEWMDDGGEQVGVWEQDAFKTKEELLKSL